MKQSRYSAASSASAGVRGPNAGSALWGALFAFGCSARGLAPAQTMPSCPALAAADSSAKAVAVPLPLDSETSPFVLKPDWQGPCVQADKVDVNLGHTPESFIRAAKCQISGHEPSGAELELWSGKLVYGEATRRIDVVRTMCRESARQCQFTYSDPWREQVELTGSPERKTAREIGAVLMFFFSCPGAVNCAMDWANTHAPGMAEKSPVLAFDKTPSAFYAPSEPGFWRRELQDAKYAGLSFLMPNVYGPDIEGGKLEPLERALDSLIEPIRIALFDDTWAWGEPWFGKSWQDRPDLRDADHAAKTLYNVKWKPFFSQIDKRHWFRFKGKPFIYFYNAGTLGPRDQSAPVLAKMKEMFRADFGEEPFLAVDLAFFDDPTMDKVADQKFQWFTFKLPTRRSSSTMNGVTMDHAMVKWDALARDQPEIFAQAGDLLVKDDSVLAKVLADSADADLLVLATWNDLGEGTGINRNYDYYSHGKWLSPDHFMRMIRQSQMTPRKK